MTSIEQAKEDLRQSVLASRIEADKRLRAQAARLVTEHFLRTINLEDNTCIAGYWPLTSELDTQPLLKELITLGHRVVLPVVVRPKTPLTFRRWQPGVELVEGYAGTKVPPAESPAAEPDILIVPLIAFDRAGYRLGYGAGFYDYTLQNLRKSRPIIAVGLAYAAQQVPFVPHEGHDAPLDWVITEGGALKCGAS